MRRSPSPDAPELHEWTEIVVLGAEPPTNLEDPSHERFWTFEIARASDPGGLRWQIRRPDDNSAQMFRDLLDTGQAVQVPAIELREDAERVA